MEGFCCGLNDLASSIVNFKSSSGKVRLGWHKFLDASDTFVCLLLLDFYVRLLCSGRLDLSIHILFKTIFGAVGVEFGDRESIWDIGHIRGNLIQILLWGVIGWIDWCYRVDVGSCVLLWCRIWMESLLNVSCIAMLGLWLRFFLDFAA